MKLRTSLRKSQLTVAKELLLAYGYLCSLLLAAADPASSSTGANPTATPSIPSPSLGTEARVEPLIGFTELRTDLPGGRHANVRTMRAVVVKPDGSGRTSLGEQLVDGPDAWTQFVGWSPDGTQAILSRGWDSPDNARWEEEHSTFRMEPGQWMLDSCLLDLRSGRVTNLTAIERVSHYNGGLFFLPDRKSLGFTPLIGGISKPFLMDLDGRNKRDVSGQDGGFAYGYSASPDGRHLSYHEDYQIFIANADGSGKKRIQTGNPFNFGPQWSADGEWLLFVSGVRGRSNPYLVRRDGTGLRKLADLNGYPGWILFLDVPDFHEGSSDVPVWDREGRSVFYTAKVDQNVELFRVWLDGKSEQLTRSKAGSLHYHPQPSPDGKELVYGSKRDGIRQIYTMQLANHEERQVTKLEHGYAAMWPHWRPLAPAVVQLPAKDLPVPGETLYLDGNQAFLIAAATNQQARNKNWVWYAPTLPGLPGREERWMFERFLQAGIAIAGVDVGESYGNPEGQALFSKLYAELTTHRGYATKPILLGRSRGGLMTLSWAVKHPDKVGGVAGIYPVCNLASYPGLKRACGAYHLTEAELTSQLQTYNPIDGLNPLARAGVPLFAIHGDVDKVVPLDANSGILKKRYEEFGGTMHLIVASGQDHNMWEGFFQCRELVDFVVRTASSLTR